MWVYVRKIISYISFSFVVPPWIFRQSGCLFTSLLVSDHREVRSQPDPQDPKAQYPQMAFHQVTEHPEIDQECPSALECSSAAFSLAVH